MKDAHVDVDSDLPGRVVGRIRRDVPLAALDALLVLPAYLIPLVFRFHGQVPSENWLRFWELLPAIVAIHLFSNYRWRLYGQMWRYASVQEARRVLLAGLCSFVAVVALDVVLGLGAPAASRCRWSRSGAPWPSWRSARSGSRAGCSPSGGGSPRPS